MSPMKASIWILALLLMVTQASPVAAQNAISPADPAPANTPTLEDLMNVEVTSVSRRDQRLAEVGSAISVLTAEDIRRSGATNIPDLLRLVPGVDVAQVDAHTWAISIRGYNDVFANKVLVVIDGRSVYSPLTSGVNWDQQDVPIEDISRIEVIRGAAGTIWGANAVNGVISITTKKATPGEGGLVRSGAGSRGSLDGLLQYGGATGTNGAYRIFADYQDTAALPKSSAVPSDDDWHSLHGGVRVDLNLSPRDALTVEGDTEHAEASNTSSGGNQYRSTSAGADLVANWVRTLANGSEMFLGIYDDWYNRTSQAAELRNTFDVDLHHHLTAGPRNDILWGLGYRVTTDRTTPGGGISYMPADVTQNLFSAFARDEIRLSNPMSLTLGSKIEHNAYTGFEFEPGVQLVFRTSPKQRFWLSFARAVREPARADTDLQLGPGPSPQPSGGVAMTEVLGTPGDKSEHALTWEAGHRYEWVRGGGHAWNRNISLDSTVFYSVFHNLSTVVPGSPFLEPGTSDELIYPFYYRNTATGHTYGGEAYATWKASDRWSVNLGYSVTHIDIDRDDLLDATPGSTDSTTPRGQFQFRNQFSVWKKIEWDTSLFQVSALGSGGSGNVAGYTRLDSRLGRHFGEFFDISVAGQNLLQPTHAESGDWNGYLHSLIARSIYLKLSFRF